MKKNIKFHTIYFGTRYANEMRSHKRYVGKLRNIVAISCFLISKLRFPIMSYQNNIFSSLDNFS